MVQDRFGGLLPGRGKENPLAQRAALARSVKGDDGEADLRQRPQKREELFDERTVAAMEDEGGEFFARGRQAEPGQVAPGVGDLKPLVTRHALHAAGESAGKVIV